ncbi:uncharacterized protein LOC134443444 [Engraulis encrasicolus]|uniref:uncharacterized protein LOC134443444 n=1 Tax=Engraulis encrasicolus TaxID=184585 RepID=UPI002FD502D6
MLMKIVVKWYGALLCLQQMGRRNKKSQAARRRYVPLDLDAEGQRQPKVQKSFADVVKPVERPQSTDDVESRQRFSEAPLSAEVLQTSETVALPTQPASLSLCDTSISPDITDFSIFPILHNNKTSKSTLHSRSNKLNDPVNKSVLSNKCNDSVTKPVLSNNLNHGQMTSITQPLNLPRTAMQVTDNYVKAIHSSFIQPVGVADNCVITGSFHQGDAQFGDAAERQCGPTSLVAALKCKMKNVLTWDCTDINDVVVQGTSLYNSLRNANKIKDVNQRRSYVSVTELPKKHYVWNTGFSIRYGESFTGAIDNENDNGLSDLIMPLDVALQRTLLNYNAGVVTIRSSTFAVVKEGSCFAFFDSHGRKVNKDGRLASSVTFFSSINSLYNYVDQLGRLFRQSLPDEDNEVLFEVTGVDVMTIPYDPVSSNIDGDANCSYACNTVDLTYISCETNSTKAEQKQVIDLESDDDVIVTSDFDGPGKSHKELSGKPKYENPNKRKSEAMFGS